MKNKKLKSELFFAFIQTVKLYPLKSFLYLTGSLVIAGMQILSIGAAYPILMKVTGREHGNEKILKFFDFITGVVGLEKSLVGYIILFLILGIISALLFIAVEIYRGRFIRFLEFKESESLLKTVVNSRWEVLRNLSHGDFLNAIIRDSEQKVKVIKFNFLMLSGLFQLLFFTLSVFYLNWQLALVSILLISASFLIFLPMYKLTTTLGEKYCDASVSLNENILNALRAMKNIKSSSLEERIFIFLRPFLYRIANLYYKQGNLEIFQSKISEMVGILVLCILLYVGFTILKISFTELALILVLFNRMVPKYREISDNFHRALAHVPSIWRINSLREKCLANQTARSGEKISKIQSISFNEVSFCYLKDIPVIDQATVKFKKGEFWAITGPTGTGKTTCLDMISGLIEPNSGFINYNEIDSKNINIVSLHQKIGYLTQASFIFSGSIMENISWGNNNLDKKKIDKAIALSQLTELINEKGLDFQISESGQNLSGGQKQRIAIARTFLQDYDFILMDEPSSALDPGTEKDFMAALHNLKGKVGIIMVTHREEYLKYADHIVHINDGKAEVIK